MSNHDFKIDLTEGRNNFVKPLENIDEANNVKANNVKANNVKANNVKANNVKANNVKASNNVKANNVKASNNVKEIVNTINNLNKKQELPMDKEFLSLLLINLYEYFLGLVFGFLFNEFMYLIFPFNKASKPNVFGAFIFLIIFVTIIITCALVLRKSSMYLPYISDIRKTYQLNHPPPIAMTFSLWRTINQLKKRSKYIQERIFEVSK
jgi:hypothetical protein